MGSIDYKKLYKLQDKVLKSVFETEDAFYLTGGTALSRFYQAKRYSDDLNFFCNNSTRFHFAVKNILAVFSKTFHIETELDSRDFVRIKIDEQLQVDFVNDRVPRYKEPSVLDNGYKIDTIENICLFDPQRKAKVQKPPDRLKAFPNRKKYCIHSPSVRSISPLSSILTLLGSIPTLSSISSVSALLMVIICLAGLCALLASTAYVVELNNSIDGINVIRNFFIALALFSKLTII